jgi:hypothetical protein
VLCEAGIVFLYIIQMNLASAHGRAMAQAVSLRPVTSRGGFDPRLVRVRFVVDRAALGQDYLRVVPSFPRQYNFTSAPHSASS